MVLKLYDKEKTNELSKLNIVSYSLLIFIQSLKTLFTIHRALGTSEN